MRIPETPDLAQVPVVILAGGRGARFDHESQFKPKPMIRVAGKPILRHIVDSLVQQGFREFIVAGGWLVGEIHKYFDAEGAYYAKSADFGFEWKKYRLEYPPGVDATVTVADTGEDSHTGKRLGVLWENGLLSRDFVLTYGDGLSDVDMAEVISHHRMYSLTENRTERVFRAPWVTMTAVRPPGRFGVVDFWDGQPDGLVKRFEEKTHEDWINGGFMYVDPQFVAEHIITDEPWGYNELESRALVDLAYSRRLLARRHLGYWQCMDTRRDLEKIEKDVAAHGGLPWYRGN
jgi:glucose-1-phosphate cytidylyltransferase